MKKHKAIAIPVIYNGDVPRFLTVRDKRFKEWIFVTGGCRRREINNPLRTALRELEEETRGVVSLKRGEYTTFSFTVKESPTIDLEYTVSFSLIILEMIKVIWSKNSTKKNIKCTLKKFI